VLLYHNAFITTEPVNKTHHNAHEYWRETQYIMIFVYGIFGEMTSFFYLEALQHMRIDIHSCHVSSHGPGPPGHLPLWLQLDVRCTTSHAPNFVNFIDLWHLSELEKYV